MQIDVGKDDPDHFIDPEERLRIAMARQQGKPPTWKPQPLAGVLKDFPAGDPFRPAGFRRFNRRSEHPGAVLVMQRSGTDQCVCKPAGIRVRCSCPKSAIDHAGRNHTHRVMPDPRATAKLTAKTLLPLQ
jgi:hypothetical protein